MKRILFALAFSLISSSAFAVCGAIPLPILDGAGVSRNISSATAADGNCKTYIDADTSSQLHTDMIAPIVAGTNLIGKVGIDQTTDGTTNGVRQTNAYPAGAIPLTASATGTTAATTATLAGAVGKTTYICGYSIRANATAAVTVTNTLTGVITATMSSIMWVPANTAGLGVDEQIFVPCIPASGTNQAIAAVSGAPGTGGVVSSKAWGYQQ